MNNNAIFVSKKMRPNLGKGAIMGLKIDLTYTGISEEELGLGLDEGLRAKETLFSKRGKGNDFLGWLDYYKELDEALLTRIETYAEEIRARADVFLVLGIGGSYLGSKSFIEASMVEDGPELYFMGHNIDGLYVERLLKYLRGRSVYVNVISKSGTTTETAIAFRTIRQFMEEEYGGDYYHRIIATTDRERGSLKEFSVRMGIRTLIIPDDIGGRYSIFTPCGLLPISVKGIDIREIKKGYQRALEDGRALDSLDNPALKYACIRNHYYRSGKKIEFLVNYLPRLNALAEWWKQLYGESEGKERKGLFPASMSFTTDLHSLGQYCQEGPEIMMETVVHVKNDGSSIRVPREEEDFDQLKYLEDRTYSEINEAAMRATLSAHSEGGLPCLVLELDDLSPFNLAYLYSFFMLGCGISAYMLDVNPFDQPGVEMYKKNMFKILGKPGYE